jgi:ribonuclease HI
VVWVFLLCVWFVLVWRLSCLMLDFHMSTFTSIYIGCTYGAYCSTWSITSTAWVILSLTDKLVSSCGIFLGPTTKNIVEYSVVIEILSKAITLSIFKLVVYLDSQLVVYQLNNVNIVRNCMLLRKFLRVRLLERQFNYIYYDHVPRSLNTLDDSLANYVLD